MPARYSTVYRKKAGILKQDRAPHDEWHIDWEVMGQRAPAREDDHGGLRPWRRPNFHPAEDAWMDMYTHDRNQCHQAIECSQGGQFGPQD